MMIFKKTIPRRTFLRGVGATIAIPLLDAMVPAFASTADTAAKPATRLSFVYVPNGIIMDKWTPAAEGTYFEMTPILEPLVPFRDRLLVLSGLDNISARPYPSEGGGGAHSHAGAAYLTGVHPTPTAGSDARVGVSVDQIAAKEFAKHTQVASLELSLDATNLAGICEAGYSCAYLNTLSWRSPTTPMPTENNPRAVFERLFGDSDSADPEARLGRIQEDRSILDFFTKDGGRLLTGLGPPDRAKLTEYLDAVRDIERRIQIAEEQASREVTLDRPVGIPATFQGHAKLMFDLQAIAYQADVTRVTTFIMSRESSRRTYSEIGIPDAHHPLTHHAGDPEKIAKVIKINLYHAKMFAYFLEKLRSTPDGDGSLLDHSIIIYGGGISDGNTHSYDNLPVLVAGGGADKVKGGRHLRYPKDTPMANLYLTVLNKLGIPVESFGDSTGKLELLSDV